MANASRSGRVTLDPGEKRTVIAGNLSGNTAAIYRFFNSGRKGDTIKILEEVGSGFSDLAEVKWKDSVDVPVNKNAISVEAGTEEAEVVYDFLGLA